jgi:hypothetical protein
LGQLEPSAFWKLSYRWRMITYPGTVSRGTPFTESTLAAGSGTTSSQMGAPSCTAWFRLRYRLALGSRFPCG